MWLVTRKLSFTRAGPTALEHTQLSQAGSHCPGTHTAVPSKLYGCPNSCRAVLVQRPIVDEAVLGPVCKCTGLALFRASPLTPHSSLLTPHSIPLTPHFSPLSLPILTPSLHSLPTLTPPLSPFPLSLLLFTPFPCSLLPTLTPSSLSSHPHGGRKGRSDREKGGKEEGRSEEGREGRSDVEGGRSKREGLRGMRKKSEVGKREREAMEESSTHEW